jgi:PAS domain S-box-containing protein
MLERAAAKPLDTLTILNRIPGCHLILLADAPRFTIVGATEAYLRSTLVKRADIIGCGVFEALTDDVQNPEATGVKNLSASLQAVLEHKQEHRMADQRYDILNPQTRRYEYRVWRPVNTPVFDDQGAVQYIIHTVEDVTAHLRLQEAERRSHQKLVETEKQQTFLLQLNDHLRLLTDPLAIQYEAARLLGLHLGAHRVGYAEDAGDGKTVVVTTDYTNGLSSIKGVYTYDDYGPELLQTLWEGRSVVRSDIANDPSLSKAEKEAHAALQLGATLNVPLLRSGKLMGVFFMHYKEAHSWTEAEVSLLQRVAEHSWDAVVRARVEQDLRESEERLRLLANVVPQSIWITDAEGRTEFLNKHWCDYCGEPYAHTTAADIALKYVHPDDAPRLIAAFGEAMRTGMPFEVEQRNRSREGEYRWFLNRANPYRDPVTGRIIKWFGIGVDIHDRKLTEQALRQSEEVLEKKIQERTLELENSNQELKRSNKNLEEFAYAASHDMKEPIRKIHFFADRLKGELGDQLTESQCRLFERLESATKRMGSLIDDLLTYSQVSRSTSKLELVDLNEMVKLAREDLDLKIGEKKPVITVDPLPTLMGHKRQLQQLFENLLSNALKYSKEGVVPQINIHYRLLKGGETTHNLSAEESSKLFHLVEVQDNGIGFAPEDSTRIFNMFQRLHGRSEYEGSGIGLSIVLKVVENHKGHVWAEAEPGKGATFSIMLPAGT